MDEYDAIARRFFAHFLELKMRLDAGAAPAPNYEKKLAEYRRAAEQFKKAATDMAEEKSRLEEALALAEEEIARERGLKNEALIAYNALKEKLEGLGVARNKDRETGYSFLEHLGPESRRAWESLMRAPESLKESDYG